MKLEASIKGEVPRAIATDRLRIHQMLVNLIDNAIKFTERGVIRLTAQVTASDGSDPPLQLEVSDTGMGMTAAEMAGLFHPFYQIRPNAARQPSRHRAGPGHLPAAGTVSSAARSRCAACPSSGSTFALTVPVSLPAQEVVAGRHGGFRGGGSFQARKWSRLPRLHARVLLAEDHDANRRSSGSASASMAPRSSPRGTASEALDRVREAAEQGRPIEAVIMDMEMPVLDGYEAVRQLRAGGFKAPIIAVTAYAMSKDRDECLSLGCDDHISKPIDWNLFFRKLAKLLGAGAGSDLRPSNSARSAGLRPHAVEELLERRNADVDAVSLLDRAAGPSTKRGEAGGVGQDRKRCCGQAVDVEERLDKTVHPASMTSRTGGTSEARTGTPRGHRVEERPGDHERGREVDVQVAQPEDVGQVLGENAAQEEEAGKVVIAPWLRTHCLKLGEPVCSLSQP